jgi:hypothetical protein
VIDYAAVLDALTAEGLKCNYPNGGSFSFEGEPTPQTLGWIGPADSTIKPAVRPLVRAVPPPYETNLVAMASQAWQRYLPGDAWIMPASHWSYELSHGSREWMPDLIREIDLDPASLIGRTDAAAIEFSLTEAQHFNHFLATLLERLSASDFSIAFPGRKTVCMIHHHKQLWWTTTDARVMKCLADQIL